MKYKAVKEERCTGCTQTGRLGCSDFLEARKSEGLPACGDGFIYVEDNEVETKAKLKFNKEILLDKPVAIKVETEEQFKAILDWCRDEFNYEDIDWHYDRYAGSTYVGIKRNNWTWGVLDGRTPISFEAALLKEQKVEEYKEITLDMSVREIMALDRCRVEFESSPDEFFESYGSTTTIIMGIIEGNKYRYKFEPLEDMQMTLQAYRDLIEDDTPDYPIGTILVYRGRNVKIIK